MQTPACGHTRLHDRCAHCTALQAEWDSKLGEDAELTTDSRAVSLSCRAGIDDEHFDLLDLVTSQQPGAPLESSFPEGHLSIYERLLHAATFPDLCHSVCAHGRHQLTPAIVRDIWVRFLDGASNRGIGGALNLNDSLVWRTINTLTQWAELMDLDEVQDAPLAVVVLRPFDRVFDQPFIFSSWRNALWYDDDNRAEGQSDRFYRHATKSIRTILDSPACRVRIACVDGVADHIVGYSVVTGDCLQFVYVKADYRGRGIGRLLVPKSITAVSPVMTKIGRAIAIKKNFIKENANGETEERSEP